MTSALPIPTRMLVIVGVAIAALAALFVARPLLLDDSGLRRHSGGPDPRPHHCDAGADTRRQAHATEDRVAAGPAHEAREQAPPLQGRRDVRLRGHRRGRPRRVPEARRGARASGAAFVAFNVLNESTARQVQPFIGTASPPVMFVVKRPGKVVARFDGRVDETVVAQAATNAGARNGK